MFPLKRRLNSYNWWKIQINIQIMNLSTLLSTRLLSIMWHELYSINSHLWKLKELFLTRCQSNQEIACPEKKTICWLKTKLCLRGEHWESNFVLRLLPVWVNNFSHFDCRVFKKSRFHLIKTSSRVLPVLDLRWCKQTKIAYWKTNSYENLEGKNSTSYHIKTSSWEASIFLDPS